MPLYDFVVPLSVEPETVECPDDHAAWSQAIVFAGELLKDIDGRLPSSTDWNIRVSEGNRSVATIEIAARFHADLKPKLKA